MRPRPPTTPPGGLALGSALAARPGLFGAAVLRCAFLDLLAPTTSTASSTADPRVAQPPPEAGSPLAAHEVDEWGDPADPEQWEALRTACPYTNLQHAGPEGQKGQAGPAGQAPVGPWCTAVLASCATQVCVLGWRELAAGWVPVCRRVGV